MPVSCIIEEFKNVRVTSITRPERLGVGGQATSSTTIFAPTETGDNAVYQPADELELNSFAHLTDSRDAQAEGAIFIDIAPEGTNIVVEIGDLVTFTDRLGRTIREAEVQRALLNDWEDAGDVRHWELLLSGLTVGN